MILITDKRKGTVLIEKDIHSKYRDCLYCNISKFEMKPDLKKHKNYLQLYQIMYNPNEIMAKENMETQIKFYPRC